MAVSVQSRTAGGTEVEVSLEKSAGAADEGTIRVRSWKGAADSSGARPYRDEIFKLYQIATSEDGAVTTCRADVPGSDPLVTISIGGVDGGGSGSGITIDVKGTSFGIGDGRTVYEVDAEGQKTIKEFLVSSFRV